MIVGFMVLILDLNRLKVGILNLDPRSSNRKTDCYLANTPATGDYGYRGEYLFCFKDRTSKKYS